MTIGEFERTAERFVRDCAAPLHVIDEVRQCDLVRFSTADFSFRHELIQEHLYSDWLFRKTEDFNLLLCELRKPVNHPLVPSILSRQTSPDAARKLLQTVPEANVLSEVFEGRCGMISKDVLLQDSRSLISEAAADLANVTLEFAMAKDGSQTMGWPTLNNHRKWTPYETALANLIGKSVNTSVFAEAVANLVALSGASVWQMAVDASTTYGLPPRPAFSAALHMLLILERQAMDCPIGAIFHAWRHSRFVSAKNLSWNDHWPKALLSSSDASPGAQAFVLFAICELMRDAKAPAAELERIFSLAWNTRLRSLRIQALEMIRDSASRILSASPDDRNRVHSLLETLVKPALGKDTIFNTIIMDTLNAYEMIDQPVSEKDAERQLRGVLDQSSEYAKGILEIYETFPSGGAENPLAEDAYRSLGMFFEDIFQGVYYQAFESLTKDEQTAFLNLAASAKDPSFNLGYILGELVKIGSPTSLPVFLQHANTSNFHSPFWQEAVQAFLLAVIGCAKLGGDLPKWQMNSDKATEAWRILRDIIYEHFKPAPVLATIDDLWLSLRAEAPLETADALFAIENSHTVLWEERRQPFSLIALYPLQAKSILEFSLLNLDRLTLAWNFCFSADPRKERDERIVNALGQIGDQESTKLLKPFIDDHGLGKSAVAAIKSIIGRSESTKIIAPRQHGET